MKPDESAPPLATPRWERPVRHFGYWCLVCGFAAAPSFFFGSGLAKGQTSELIAMGIGVILFAMGYTAASTSAWFGRFRQKPFVERTLKIGYVTRIIQSCLSLVPPVAVIDFMAGIISVGITNAILGPVIDPRPSTPPPSGTFAGFLMATIVQGCILNALLFLFMLVVYGIQRATMKPPIEEAGLCRKCRYDLRMSRDACPECGEPIVDTKSPDIDPRRLADSPAGLEG